MEILKYNPFEMKDVIDNSKLVSDKGFSGSIILHDKKLLKIQKKFYQDLKVNSRIFAEKRFNDVYRWDKRPYVEPDQIKYLCSIQKNIHLTDFDKGIVMVNDQVCGTILTPHLDYQDLTDLETNNPKTILILLKNILNSLKELENYHISHLDLAMAERGQKPTLNILYKENDIKLCDLSGRYITYKDNFDREGMYQEFSQVILILLNKLIKNNKKYEYLLKDLSLDNIINYQNSIDTINKIEEKVYKI